MSECKAMSKTFQPLFTDRAKCPCPQGIGFGQVHWIGGRLPSGRSLGLTGRCHYSNDNNQFVAVLRGVTPISRFAAIAVGNFFKPVTNAEGFGGGKPCYCATI